MDHGDPLAPHRAATWRPLSCCVLGLLILSAPVLCAPVRLEVSLPPDTDGTGATATLKAQPVGGSEVPRGALPQEVQISVELPWSGTIDLDDAAVWQVSVTGEGLWSPERVVAPTPEGAIVRLPVRRTGRIAGRVQMPRNEPAPKELTLRFEPSPEPPAAEPFEAAQVVCPIVERAWSCEVPAGVLDIRARSASYISYYRWAVQVDPGRSTDVGTIVLRHGASVVGWLELEEAGALLPDRCEVELAPQAAAFPRNQAELDRSQALVDRVRVNDRGFFHFQGVQPGSYVLTATYPGFAPTQLFPVTVLENAETEIDRTLTLRRPVPLEVHLDPAVDPFGHPWAVRLFSISEIPGSLAEVDGALASEEGVYLKGGLSPGEYVLQVLDSRGSRMAREEIDLRPGNGSVQLELDVVLVEGRIHLGDDPLAASLSFGGRRGAVRIVMRSAEDGDFAGVLPREGDWKVYVQATSPAVRRTLNPVAVARDRGESVAELDLRLPDTRIEGEAVDEEGRGLAGAVVKVSEIVSGEPTFLRTEDDGSFSFSGVAEGPVTLDAQFTGGGRTLYAAPSSLEVREGRPAPHQRLVLREMAELTGQVLSRSGPVPGAQVVALPSRQGLPYPFMVIPQAVTDVSGTFRMAVPRDAEELEIIALPPGFALSTLQLSSVPDSPIFITVEETSGTLVLALGEAVDRTNPALPQPMVERDGVQLLSFLLRRWAEINGEDNRDPTRLVVPRLPPGQYTACLVTQEQYYFGPRSAASPAECSEGYLSPFGEMVLDLSTETDGSGP